MAFNSLFHGKWNNAKMFTNGYKMAFSGQRLYYHLIYSIVVPTFTILFNFYQSASDIICMSIITKIINIISNCPVQYALSNLLLLFHYEVQSCLDNPDTFGSREKFRIIEFSGLSNLSKCYNIFSTKYEKPVTLSLPLKCFGFSITYHHLSSRGLILHF